MLGCDKMETIKALAVRKAVRIYRKEQISDSELNTVLCAGSLAPVGLGMFNSYRLTVVRDRDFMERVEKATIRAFDDNSEMKSVFYGAPTLIIISANKSQDTDSPFAKIPAEKMLGLEVASAACIADTMLIAATDIGLASIYLCAFVEGFNAEPDLIKELGLPDGFSPIAGILLGYTDEVAVERKLEINLKVNYK
jgi:nitroreductase